MNMRNGVLFVAALAAGCSTPNTRAIRPARPGPSTVKQSCDNDADCVIDTFAGCCLCAAEPFARRRCGLEDEACEPERLCAGVSCEDADPSECDGVSSPEQYRAVCAAGQCERRPN